MPKSPTCLVCGSKQLNADLKIYYWKNWLLEFDRCTSCGLSFSNPMPDEATISRGNNALVKYYQSQQTVADQKREGRNAYLKGKMKARALKSWKQKGKLLEIGCYHGLFLKGFQDSSDWEVEGVEISSILGQHIQQNLGIHCHTGTLETADLKDTTYDYVVCHDLIEHVRDPLAFLKIIKRILKPGGRVEILTPNGPQNLAYSRRAHEAGKIHSMLLNHIVYFTPKSLQVACEVLGLKLVRAFCFGIKNILKDFNVFGMGTPLEFQTPPLVEEYEHSTKPAPWIFSEKSFLEELKNHPKTSNLYGWFKIYLPNLLKLKVPFPIALGHEISFLAEKPKS